MLRSRAHALKNRWWGWLFRRAERLVLEGVSVGVLWPTEDESSVIVRKLEAALRLIARYDRRRFDRLRQDINGILVFGTVGALAQWVQTERLIVIRQTYVANPKSSIAELAATLVHEGTHAWLSRLGFGYEPTRRTRIEAVCFRSEMAFARHLPDPGGIVQQAERQLARDPSYWATSAFRDRTLEELRILGVPRWLVRLLGLASRGRAA